MGTPTLHATVGFTGILGDATTGPWSALGALFYLQSLAIERVLTGRCWDGPAAWQNVGSILFVFQSVPYLLMAARARTRFWLFSSTSTIGGLSAPIWLPSMILSSISDNWPDIFYSIFMCEFGFVILPVILVVSFAGPVRIAQVPVVGPPFVRAAFGRPLNNETAFRKVITGSSSSSPSSSDSNV